MNTNLSTFPTTETPSKTTILNGGAGVLKRFFPDVKFTVEEEKAPSPCPKCDGSGYIKTWENGLGTSITVCPVCAERHAHEKRLKESGISKADYERYTLSSFQNDTSMAMHMKDVALAYIANAKPTQSIGFFGKAGTGKTHICIALCQTLGKPHYYWQYRAEIQKIKNAAYRLPQEYDQLIKKAATASLLYIDDLFKGAVQNKGLYPQDLQIMFDIINRRYVNHLPTIFSSEYSLDTITGMDEAIGGRIWEMCTPYAIECKGASRRLPR